MLVMCNAMVHMSHHLVPLIIFLRGSFLYWPFSSICREVHDDMLFVRAYKS